MVYKKNPKFSVCVWDTLGQDKYRTIAKSYYRDAAGCLLLYDITKQQSMDDLTKWLEDLENNANNQVVIVLVGNKCDLENQRTVELEVAQEFAESRDLPLKEVSAKTGEGVEETFEMLIDKMIELIEEGQNSDQLDYIKIDKKTILITEEVAVKERKQKAKKGCKC